MNKYVYRWTEGENGPYEIRGDALSIYRAQILIAHNRNHIVGQVLTSNYELVDIDLWMGECSHCLGMEIPEKGKTLGRH